MLLWDTQLLYVSLPQVVTCQSTILNLDGMTLPQLVDSWREGGTWGAPFLMALKKIGDLGLVSHPEKAQNKVLGPPILP